MKIKRTRIKREKLSNRYDQGYYFLNKNYKFNSVLN